MIPLLKYNNHLHDIKDRVNVSLQEIYKSDINALYLSPTDKSLMHSISDNPNIIMGASYPDTICTGNDDGFSNHNKSFIFILQKLRNDLPSDDLDIAMAKLQNVAMKVRDELLVELPLHYQLGDKISIEWEFGVLGGFSGLSIGFDLINYD